MAIYKTISSKEIIRKVFRDLKPENLLYKDNDCDEIKLIDFGLSEIM